MTRLFEAEFPTVSIHDRPGEPVSLPLPFGKGLLPDPDRLDLRDGERSLPVQAQVTSRWDDGSVRWLVAHTLVDLPGLAGKRIAVELPDAPPQRPDAGLTVEERGGRLTVDTGALRFSVAADRGFDGFESLAPAAFDTPGVGPRALRVTTTDGSEFTSVGGAATWRVLEAGPVRAWIECSGRLAGDGGLGYRVRLSAWAGRSEVELEVTLIQDTDAAVVELAEVVLPITGDADPGARRWLGSGNYRTSVREAEGDAPLRHLVDADALLFSSNEQTDETFHTDLFADWTQPGRGGLAVTIFQAYQQYPKALEVRPDGIAVELLPTTDEGPIRFLQGMAKTHRMQLAWHAADAEREAIVHRSLQYQMPDRASLPAQAYTAAGVWPEGVFPRAQHLRLEAYATQLADDRGRAYGWLHWGDGPDWGYTHQGRGRGKLVWTNNEYDLPHVAYLHFAGSGERRFRDMAEVAAQHWIDVDIVHHHADPSRVGGQVIHSADHVSGGLSPCHEWVEGLLDYHHFTGRPEALEAAVGIADHVLGVLDRNEALRKPGASAARVTGWALRTLMAMYRETYDDRYLAPAREIVDNFIAWHAQYGGFLAPYHSHTLCRVPFMIAIACGSLMRYWWQFPDQRVADLVVGEMRAVIETCQRPDGRFVYKDLPSLHRRGAGIYVLEALAYAYDLSGDPSFLVAGLPELLATVEGWGTSRPTGTGGGRVHLPEEQTILFGRGSGPKEYAAQWLPFMTFYRAIAEADLLPPSPMAWAT